MHWPRLGNHVQLSGYRRRTNQSGRTVFLFWNGYKTAAQNSLYIILFSQIASLLTTLLTHSVPDFAWSALILMVCGGIGGGMAGRAVNKKISGATVDKLFMVLMVAIIFISVYNTVRYSMA